ncbi:MAG: SH3 domain-containing protein [Pleurocapsa sp. SU_196_0]|nr:SH3 domain-containing protein [Pleurocapsa sp. SU_196_0]
MRIIQALIVSSATWMLVSGLESGWASYDERTSAALPVLPRAQSVVSRLPFPDNPDLSACGIPTPWGLSSPAWLDGNYQGKLWEPRVFLYDSHARHKVVGSAPSGSRVQILLHQSNPVLDFYLVRTLNTGQVQEGWVPAPFLRLKRP